MYLVRRVQFFAKGLNIKIFLLISFQISKVEKWLRAQSSIIISLQKEKSQAIQETYSESDVKRHKHSANARTAESTSWAHMFGAFARDSRDFSHEGPSV